MKIITKEKANIIILLELFFIFVFSVLLSNGFGLIEWLSNTWPGLFMPESAYHRSPLEIALSISNLFFLIAAVGQLFFTLVRHFKHKSKWLDLLVLAIIYSFLIFSFSIMDQVISKRKQFEQPFPIDSRPRIESCGSIDERIMRGRVIVHISRKEKEQLRTYLAENQILFEEALPEDMFPSQAEDPDFFLILKVEDGKEKYWADRIKNDLLFVKSAELEYYGCYF